MDKYPCLLFWLHSVLSESGELQHPLSLGKNAVGNTFVIRFFSSCLITERKIASTRYWIEAVVPFRAIYARSSACVTGFSPLDFTSLVFELFGLILPYLGMITLNHYNASDLPPHLAESCLL